MVNTWGRLSLPQSLRRGLPRRQPPEPSHRWPDRPVSRDFPNPHLPPRSLTKSSRRRQGCCSERGGLAMCSEALVADRLSLYVRERKLTECEWEREYVAGKVRSLPLPSSFVARWRTPVCFHLTVFQSSVFSVHRLPTLLSCRAGGVALQVFNII